MKLAVFSSKPYVREYFDSINEDYGHEIRYFDPRLNPDTVPLAQGYDAVCPFVNDVVNREVIEKLAEYGVKIVSLRSAGFNNVDIDAAREHGIAVTRVPAYSPNSVAEHTVGLALALNRRICRANTRVHDGNMELTGLMGFDFKGRTVGVIGTGKIGLEFARIMIGFGCEVLGFDPYPSDEFKTLGASYVELDELYERSDVISLHCPLTPETHYMINAESIAKMKTGVMVLNTSRGPLIDTEQVIEGLKSRKIGYLGLDVYEEESDLFFEDLSSEVIEDDVFARLLTFPNVVITGHQAFFTHEAMTSIAHTTLKNVADFEKQALEEKNVVDGTFVKQKA